MIVGSSITKYQISRTWVYGLKALANSSRHWWTFNLISGSLRSLKGWQLKTRCLPWKAGYRRMRKWPWQACFLGVIFNSCFLLILLVTRPITFSCFWVFFFCFCFNLWPVVLADGCDCGVVPPASAKLCFIGARLYVNAAVYWKKC